MLGIYELSERKMSFETGIEKLMLSNDLKALEKDKKIKRIDNYLIICNYLKHQNFNTNMKKSAIDIYNSLPQVLKKENVTLSKNNPLKSFETLSNHMGILRKVEVEVEVEVEREREYEVEEKETSLAYDFLKKERPAEMQYFEMQNKSQVKDFEKMVMDFNDTVDQEQLRYNYKILRARLNKYTRNWIANQNKYSSSIKTDSNGINSQGFIGNLTF